jgi:phosphoribosylglycinamide formyltransferase-1
MGGFKVRIAVLASGRGSNLQALIEAVENRYIPAEIGVVVSDKPDAQALQRAVEHGIETAVFIGSDFPDRKTFDEALVGFLKEKDIDLICLAGFMRILGPEFVQAFPNRIVNIHPSLLPAFPGLNAQQQALDYGVKYSGCTVHFVDEGMDTGPIIGQRVVPIIENDTVETLSARILEQEHQLYPLVVRQLVLGNVRIVGRKVIIHEGGNVWCRQRKERL